jgi:hypothetical protein
MKIKNPLHPGEITAEWIVYALRSGGVIKQSIARILNKEILGGGRGFLSSVVRVSLDYDKQEKNAPKSVVVKIEPESDTLHRFGDELNAFQREIRFYKEVASNVPIRLPILYFSVDEPPAYSMVMEDLSSYTPGDQVIGMHRNQVMATVEILAKLQARYWNNIALEQLKWMPTTNAVGVDYQQKWVSFVTHFGSYVDREGLEVGERLGNSISWLEKEIEKRPKTIVHTDLREDNLLFGDPNSDEAILILDWQLAIRSIGVFDVARIIGGSELPSERSGHQFEVLRRWYDALIREGVRDYSWEEAVCDFRLGALQLLCFPVHFHVAFIGSEGRSMELAKAICRRVFSSAVEIDAATVLP